MSGRMLVTGGAGFIGSHVAEAFLARGWEVAVVDDLSTGRRENVPGGAAFFEADICDRDELAGAFREARPEVICHLAAQTSVRRSTEDPAADLRANVEGTLRLITLAVETKASYFLFSSTGGAIYGDGAPLPTPEDAPCRPASPYGVSKLCGEHYLEWAERFNGLAGARLRYANVYGPRQDPHGEAGVVAIFSQRMLAGEETVINGAGTQTRDYLYVGDVAAANVAAVEKRLTGAFNVGTGVETDVNDLHHRLAEIAGYGREAVHGPPRPGEQERSSLDAGALGRAAGWRPETGLEAGLARTVAWFRERAEAGT